MSGCSGKCCAVFNFPLTPDELRERAGDGEEKRAVEDRYIADMMIPLEPEAAIERMERFDVTPPEGFDLVAWAEHGPTYTCRHWDEETRLCTAYEDRPQMCADYPYAKKCQHDCECDCRPPMHVRTRWAALEVRSVVLTAERETPRTGSDRSGA